MSTTPNRGLLLAAALIACLLIPGAATAKVPNPASTKIVPGKSIAGVKLDMTKKQVFAKWGKGSCLSETFASGRRRSRRSPDSTSAPW